MQKRTGWRKLVLGAALLLVLIALGATPAVSFAAGNSQTSSMQLSLASLACSGTTVTAMFRVTGLPAAADVTSYGTVSYTANGAARTAAYSSRAGTTAFYVDSMTVPAGTTNMSINISRGSVTVVTTSGSQILALSNPRTYNVTCAVPATNTPSATATSGATRTATSVATDTPTAVAGTSVPTNTPTVGATAVATETTGPTETTAPTETPGATSTSTPSFIGGSGSPPPSTLPETGGASNLALPGLGILLVLLAGGLLISRRARG